MTQTQAFRSLTVAQWEALVQSGADIPVKTVLDGVSMQPLIRKGVDTVTIIPLARPLKPGDIVLFRRMDGAYVVHRVRRMLTHKIVTLGDNCWCEDAPIDPACVLGLASHMQRNGRTISLDNALSRALGRCWMGCHKIRMGYRRLRALVFRLGKKVIPWKRHG